MNKQNITIDNFGTEDTYKLYRTVYEIIHPTISKKNISNYKIIVEESLTPLRIFYPQKISKLEKAIIYVPGRNWIVNGIKSYNDVCLELVTKLDTIIIALDYELQEHEYDKTVNTCYNTLKYLVKGLNEAGIEKEKITVIGDSIGASIIANISMIQQDDFPKQVLLYPVLNLAFDTSEKDSSLIQNNKLDSSTLSHLKLFSQKYINKKYSSPLKCQDHQNWPTTLIITGDIDPVRDEGIMLGDLLKQASKKNKTINLKFAPHGFLNHKDEETIEECIKEIQSFIIKK